MTTETLLPAKKDRRVYDRAYRLRNPEKCRQSSRNWNRDHKEQKAEYNAKWAKANPDRIMESREKWKKANPEEYRQTAMRGTKKGRAKRKDMGFQPLNEWFEGSNGHHVNNDQVIYIPAEMHRRYHNLRTGEGMAEMNALAFQYLFEHT